MGSTEPKADTGVASSPVKIWNEGPQVLEMIDAGDETELNPEPFPFMRLPPEIRTMIYEKILVMPMAIQVGSSLAYSSTRNVPIPMTGAYRTITPSKEDGRIPQRPVLRLFETTKTIYQESVLLYFRYNLFNFRYLFYLEKFLIRLAPHLRRALKSVSLDYAYGCPARTMKLLAGCIGLRSLTIRFIHPGYIIHMPSDGMKLMRLYGLKDLMKLRGLEKVEVQYEALSTLPDSLASIFDDLPEFKKTLEILTKPYTKAQLTRQDRKDFPQKSTRQVFGKANVVTRSEQRFIDSQASLHS